MRLRGWSRELSKIWTLWLYTVRYVYISVVRDSEVTRTVKLSDLLSFATSLSDEREVCRYLEVEDGMYICIRHIQVVSVYSYTVWFSHVLMAEASQEFSLH